MFLFVIFPAFIIAQYMLARAALVIWFACDGVGGLSSLKRSFQMTWTYSYTLLIVHVFAIIIIGVMVPFITGPLSMLVLTEYYLSHNKIHP